MEFSFDVSEAGCAERLSEALRHIREHTGGESVSEVIEGHCRMIAAFFDELFGEGVGVKLCGSVMSSRAYSAVYLDFAAFIKGQIDALSRLREETESKYLRRREQFPAFAVGSMSAAKG